MASPRGFIVGAAIGSGTTALAAERGGADLLLAINAGRLRNMGAPSIACMLPILDATSLTLEFARREILTQCRAPVLLGVNVWGAEHDVAARAEEIRDAGFAGAVNFPSCMHYERPMQQILSRAGRGIEAEVAQLEAVRRIGLKTMFYCANRTQARLAADAGIDLICLNLGWNVGGALGHRQRDSLEAVAMVAREVGRLVRRINPGTRFLLEGGPIATAGDLARVISLAEIDGYVGGSTIERIPLENSVANQIDRFRQAARRGPVRDAGRRRLVSWGRGHGLVGQGKAQIEFLRRLRALSGSSSPTLLLAERGADTKPVVSVMASAAQPKGAAHTLEIDLAGEESSVRARELLFGASDKRQRPPALGDDRLGLVVLRAPERLPAATQRRLGLALREGSFRASSTRRMQAMRPRVLLICETSSAGGRSGQTLASTGIGSDLAAAFDGRVLRLPPLRERIDDLATLVEHLSPDTSGEAMGRASFSAAAFRQLEAHRWPGNERELRNLLGMLAGRADDGPVEREELVFEEETGVAPKDTTGGSERERIVDALWRNGFNRTRTADYLGISRKTLYNKIRRYGLSG